MGVPHAARMMVMGIHTHGLDSGSSSGRHGANLDSNPDADAPSSLSSLLKWSGGWTIHVHGEYGRYCEGEDPLRHL